MNQYRGCYIDSLDTALILQVTPVMTKKNMVAVQCTIKPGGALRSCQVTTRAQNNKRALVVNSGHYLESTYIDIYCIVASIS